MPERVLPSEPGAVRKLFIRGGQAFAHLVGWNTRLIASSFLDDLAMQRAISIVKAIDNVTIMEAPPGSVVFLKLNVALNSQARDRLARHFHDLMFQRKLCGLVLPHDIDLAGVIHPTEAADAETKT